MQAVRIWLLASRPKTLTIALVPILVGSALAYAIQGTFRWELSLFAFLSSVFVQIGTNLINDAVDFEKGADTEVRLGPVRAAQSGLLTARQVRIGGIVSFVIASLLAFPLLQAGGWPILLIGIFSLISGYAYTGGPFPLAYLGLGDLFVLIFFGWVAVMGMYFLHTGVWDSSAWIAGSQVGLLATAVIAINNFRDYQNDRKVGKMTLAARLGPRFARMELLFLFLVPFAMGLFWWSHGFAWAAALPLLACPVALRLSQRILVTEPGVVFNQFLFQGAILHLFFGILLTVGFWLR